MRPVLKIIVFIVLGIIVISALFSLIGVVLGLTFGILGFIWRLFGPIILIVLIVWLVVKRSKAK